MPITEQLVFEKRSIQDKAALRIYCPVILAILNGIVRRSATSARDARSGSLTTIYEPYELIIRNHQEISHADSSQAGNHPHPNVQLLLDFVRRENPYVWDKAEQIQSRRCQKIAFEELWLIYTPGSTVLRRDSGVWRAYKVEKLETSTHHGMDTKTLYCCYLDFDKTTSWLVPHIEKFLIPTYSSELSIGSLEAVPEWYFDSSDVLDGIASWGRQYWTYSEKVHYQDYSGDQWPKFPRDVSSIIKCCHTC